MTIHFVCAFVRNRAESPEAHSPGQRPVVNAPPIIRPVRAKAFMCVEGFCPFRANKPPSVYPRAMPWAKCNLALSGRIPRSQIGIRAHPIVRKSAFGRIPLGENRHSGASHWGKSAFGRIPRSQSELMRISWASLLTSPSPLGEVGD